MTTSQSRFTAAVLDSGQPVPDGLSDPDARSAGRRFDVYRNNVAVSLSEALQTGFPVIAKLLGEENMKGVAGQYLRAHPPRSPLLMQYGQDFADFLAAQPQLAHLGYLADVARLELALRRAYHAADAAPIDPARLAETPPEALMRASLAFAPAVQLLRSRWPVHDIWRFNTEPGAPKPRAEAQDVLIARPGFDPIPLLLPTGGADWIAALMQGASLGTALDAAPGLDLTPCLSLLLQGEAITSLTVKDPSE
mgnify:FL=1